MDREIFYSDCLGSLHRAALECGFAKGGIKLAPDLLPFGERAVTVCYADAVLAAELAVSPTDYYYEICSRCICCGLLFALHFEKDPLALTEGYVDAIVHMDCRNLALDAASERLGVSADALNDAVIAVFNGWVDLVLPYYNSSDGTDCIYYATLAAYQTGISMIAGRE